MIIVMIKTVVICCDIVWLSNDHHDHGFRILLSVTWELFSFLEVSPSAGIRERRDWRLVLTALVIAAWGTITAAALIIAAWWPVAAFISIACCCVAALG